MVNVSFMKNMTKESTLNCSQNILESLLDSSYRIMQKPEELSIDQIIENKFYSSQTFSEEIEKIVKENKDMKYIDAIVFFCEENNVDIESIPKLLSKPLKERLKCEAIDLNLLKKTSRAKLPL